MTRWVTLIKPLVMPFLVCMWIGCSNVNNQINNANNQTNNANNQTNNTTNQTNNNTNNQTNNTNNQTNDTNNQTAPEPHVFECQSITPAGDLVAGTYRIDGLCLGFNPFEPFEQFCPGLVLTEFESSDAFGTVWIDPPSYAIYDGATFDVTAVAPEGCKMQFGRGTCDGIADNVETLVPALTASCVDAGTGCECNVNGSLGSRLAGRIEMGGAGVANTTSYDADGDVVTDTITFNVDEVGGVFNPQSNGDLVTVTKVNDATPCEAYCLAFLARCNELDTTTGFVDEADCLTQCGALVSVPDAQTGDNVECRLFHTTLANDPTDLMNQETFCPSADIVATAPCVDG